MIKKIIVIGILWAMFPLMALWLMITHPGKCALIWKKELEGSWWPKPEKKDVIFDVQFKDGKPVTHQD